MNGWLIAAVIAALCVATRFGWDLRAASEGETKNSPRMSVVLFALLMCVVCVDLTRMYPPLDGWTYFPYALAAPCAFGYWLHKKRRERRRAREASALETSNGAER